MHRAGTSVLFLSEFGFKSHKQQSSSDLLDGGLCHRGQFSDQTHAPLELHKEAQRYHSVGSHTTAAMPAQSPGAGTLNTGQIAACLHPTGILHDNEVRGSLRQRSMQMRSCPPFTSNEAIGHPATRDPPSRYTGVRGAHLKETVRGNWWRSMRCVGGTAQGAAAIVDVN